MTNEELDRLAILIAAELRRARNAEVAPPSPRASWLPTPVRPEPPARGHDPAPWTGAGQALGDIAPVRSPSPPPHRDDIGTATAAIRAAAAGAAPATTSVRRGVKGRGDSGSAAIRRPASRLAGRDEAIGATVPIGISNRHIHLSAAHADALFGPGELAVDRTISQPGQFAAKQRVTIHGPSGRVESVRVVGPPRGETQVELAPSDARMLGIAPPVQASGSLEGSLGGIRLEGSAGSVQLSRGVIVPRRHLHLAARDGERFRLPDGAVVSVRCGEGTRAATLHGVLVRCGATHATELHLDADEARAVGVAPGSVATIVAREVSPGGRRRLITERAVRDLHSANEQIPGDALLTPSARDRARALGMRLP